MTDRKETPDMVSGALGAAAKKKKSEKRSDPVGGVALTQDEWDQLSDIANEAGVSRHKILQYAVRYYLKNVSRILVESRDYHFSLCDGKRSCRDL